MRKILFKKIIHFLLTFVIFPLISCTSAIVHQKSELLSINGINREPASEWTWNTALQFFDQKNIPPAFSENGLGNWAQCMQDQDNSKPIKTNSSGEILPACQPDTLYTWGPYTKIITFMNDAGPGKKTWNNPFSTPVYSHINPIATFGYGELPIRMKLRKNTRFVLVTDVASLSCFDAKWNNTIIVRSWKGRENSEVDYILCSPGPIESWSIGTKRHYDEMIASQIWTSSALNTNHPNQWISYMARNGQNLLNFSRVDGYDWNQDDLLKYLKPLHDSANEDIGMVVNAPDVYDSLTDHFDSKIHTYWHQ